MADWSEPTTSTVYTAVLTDLKGRDDNASTMFSEALTAATNVPTEAIKWSSSNTRFERWSGAAWLELSTTYSINVTSLGGVGLAGLLRNDPGTDQTIISGKLILDIDSAPVLDLKGGTADNVYIQLFADAAAQSTRSSLIGYATTAVDDLTVSNEISGGDILLTTVGAGIVQVNGSQVVVIGGGQTIAGTTTINDLNVTTNIDTATLIATGTVTLNDLNVTTNIDADTLVVTTAFTSPGIDDNATAERLQLSNTLLTLGPATTADFSIVRPGATGALYISGGSSNILGANILLRGETFGGGFDNDMLFRSGNGTTAFWDDSAGSWKWYTTTGGGTLGMTLSTLGLETDAGSLTMAELASVTNPGAGKGRYWVKDEASNVPMFTNDLGASYPIAIKRMKVKTSTSQKYNSATLSDDAHLIGITLDANQYYILKSFIKVDCTSATPDFKCNYTYSFAPSNVWTWWRAVDVAGTVQADVVTSPASDIIVNVAASLPVIIEINSVVLTAGFAAVVDFQFAQNTATSVGTVVDEGSWMEATRLDA